MTRLRLTCLRIGRQVHTRDRERRMRSKDPTAYIPVAVVLATPAGPLRWRRRWARPISQSQVEVERIHPHWRWSGRRLLRWLGRQLWVLWVFRRILVLVEGGRQSRFCTCLLRSCSTACRESFAAPGQPHRSLRRDRRTWC
jgi:hypothetical protein